MGRKQQMAGEVSENDRLPMRLNHFLTFRKKDMPHSQDTTLAHTVNQFSKYASLAADASYQVQTSQASHRFESDVLIIYEACRGLAYRGRYWNQAL